MDVDMLMNRQNINQYCIYKVYGMIWFHESTFISYTVNPSSSSTSNYLDASKLFNIKHTRGFHISAKNSKIVKFVSLLPSTIGHSPSHRRTMLRLVIRPSYMVLLVSQLLALC